MSDTFFGKPAGGKFDPYAQANESLWTQLASSIMGGTAISPEYINRIVIPATTNTLTAAGLGRSGAIGQAVAYATLAPQVDLLKAVLSGVPHGATATQTGREPGVFDWLDKILGLVSGGVGAYSAWDSLGSPSRDWMSGSAPYSVPSRMGP